MLSLVFRYEKHLVYSKILSAGKIGIVTILHERMHQLERFRGISGSGFDGLQPSLVMLTNSRQPFYIGDVAAFTVRADLLQIL